VPTYNYATGPDFYHANRYGPSGISCGIIFRLRIKRRGRFQISLDAGILNVFLGTAGCMEKMILTPILIAYTPK
jgi:hypothetical protein